MFDLLYISIAVIYGLLISFVIKQRMTSSAHWQFLFFLVSLLLWHISLYLYLFIPLGDQLLLVGRINYAFGPLFTFGLLSFFIHFPKSDEKIRPALQGAFWVWTIFLAGISLLTPLIDKNETYVEGIGPMVEFGEWYLLYMVHMFAMPILTLIYGLKKSLRLKGLAKTKFRIAFGVFVPTMLAFVITNGVLPLYHIFWQFYYSPIFLIPIALSSAYAMYRYRFFDLSYSALFVLRQSILLFSLLGVGTASFALLEHFFPSLHFTSFMLAAVLGCLSQQKLDQILPEFTSKSFRIFRQQLQAFQSQVYGVTNYEELQQAIDATFLLQLHFKKATLFLVRNQEISLPIPVYPRDTVIETIEDQQATIIIKQESAFAEKDRLLEAFESLEAELILPLYLNKKVIGILVLGSKEDHTPYTKEEVTEILNTRELLEISFINLLLQSDLKEENDLMKQMINDKTQKLRKQNHKIKKILQQQSDFIAVTAHEFRTPLNIALLQLNDTLDSFDHSHQVLDDMKVLESSLDKLKQLTQDLFDVQQYDLKKAQLHLKETPLANFLDEIHEQFQEILKSKSMSLSFENTLKKELSIELDQPKFRQVIHNLLSNAQKFSPEKSPLKIKLSEEKNQILIEVIDHGKGISDADKSRIFQKFQTADNRQGVGIGMGLYLCQQIIKLHKGSISVIDTAGGGSTFQIRLPK